MKLAIALLLLLSSATFSGEFVSGSNTCPASGPKPVATASYNLYQLTISSPATNAGNIVVGGPTVTTSTGGILVPGASYNANKPNAGINPATIYFACGTNTDVISWVGSR